MLKDKNTHKFLVEQRNMEMEEIKAMVREIEDGVYSHTGKFSQAPTHTSLSTKVIPTKTRVEKVPVPDNNIFKIFE